MLPKRPTTNSSRIARRGLVVAGCVVGLAVPASAQAVAVLGPTPSLAGGTVAVGDAGQGKLIVTNNSTAPDDGLLKLGELTLVPSCGFEAADPSCLVPPGADLGVVTLAATASGSGACAGRTFAVAITDVATGRVSFTPDVPVLLSASGPPASSTCVVSFPYTVNHMPVFDSNPASGKQTRMVANAKGMTANDMPADNVGYATITVVKDTPELTTKASPGVLVGGDLSVAETIDGTHPDGPMTFDLYGPGDPNCTGAKLATSSTTVNGNGTYNSVTARATTAGTYRWRASYAGDEDNNAVASSCSEPGAATVVSNPPPPPPPPPTTTPPPPPPTTTPPPPPPPAGTGGTTANPGGGSASPGGEATGTTPATGTGTGTGTGSRGTGATAKRISLTKFAVSRKSFARAKTSTKLTANVAKVVKKPKRKAAKKGTTITYTLSAPATVTIVVERVLSGRRSGTKCVKVTKKLKARRACSRYVKLTTLKRMSKKAGAKKVAFSGRYGSRPCPVGKYRLRATAIAGPGTASLERRATFKILKK